MNSENKTPYTCPYCGKDLVILVIKTETGEYGAVLGCSDYPYCKYIKPLEEKKSSAKEQMNPERKAVVLLSGGIDSAVSAGIAKKAGYELFGLSFDYGQTHKWELESAKKIAHHLGFSQHIIFPLPINQFGGSALLGDGELPKARTEAEIKEIPRTYVPARNLIFLSIGLGWAEASQADAVVLGAHTIDYSGYPDCRPEFIDAFQKVAILGTKAGAERRLIRIWAPVIHLSKVEIIKTGIELGVDFSLTFSCYDPDERGRACGQCDSCQIRKKAFRDANIPDPIIYR